MKSVYLSSESMWASSTITKRKGHTLRTYISSISLSLLESTHA